MPIIIIMAALTCPFVFAQTKWKPLKNMEPRKGGVNPISRPTLVNGEGMATPSGVKYWDILEGKGIPATKGHLVKVVYAAWIEHGKQFAGSVQDGKPPVFTLGFGQVIRGWEEGMEGMKVGGRRQLRIPPELAYGAAGVPQLVPPNATLIYDVELVELQ
jgi:FKBP-type peptidyl-prolyl cis-trans isomerase